ncbi:UNC-like C-terminal domain-containing protein [Trichoderma longibrachiatum]
MILPSCIWHGGFLLLLLLLLSSDLVQADVKPPAQSAPGQCEVRTINYITHTLPSLCFKSSWTDSVPTSTASPATANDDDATQHVTRSPAAEEEQAVPSATTPTDTLAKTPPASDTAATPFMSFEDWKEMMLKETGQDPQDLHLRNSSGRQKGDRPSPDVDEALGEEGEISLTFDYGEGEGIRTGTYADSATSNTSDDADEALVSRDGKAPIHRSKDAGKTCKERFSYSSFDAGATILKAGPQAKNAKAILVENKDSYMLLECAAQNKFVIVELSDDILIDTIVIANFEFFSSMIRHFRVSVSDRYPVKMDKWREVGIFEAANSRDIQAFLVQNPQIWAKYVRIEFLTHYGNEYYCPVSLLRVHGSRMLDSWKDSETGREDEALDGEEEEEQQDKAEEAVPIPTTTFTPPVASRDGGATGPEPPSSEHLRSNVTQARDASTASPSKQANSTKPAADPAQTSADAADAAGTASVTSQGAAKSRGGGTASASAATPTVQASFFNSITKRLQQVEANLTLSLKYVEDQSRLMQEALQKTEQKQVSKLTRFLGDLNHTVLAEMRNVREQYEQIWQSTVLALESQREQSERDIVALSTRLNLLADEVVFQKRMAIVQAILLLSCLFLVIFSRGVPIPYLAALQEQAAGFSYASPSPYSGHGSHGLYKPDPGVGPDEQSLTTNAPRVHSSSFEAGSNVPSRRMAHSSPGTADPHQPVRETGFAEPSRRQSSFTTSNSYSDGKLSDPHYLDQESRFHALHQPTTTLTSARKPLPSLPEHSAATQDS